MGKMCIHEYRAYRLCNHWAVETVHYCPETCWRAGVSGFLSPCP